MHYSINGNSQAPANSCAAHCLHHLGPHGPLATGSTWTLAQHMKFNLPPTSLTIPGQNPNREGKAIVPKAMLSNNRGKQALPDMTSLALTTRSQIFYRAEAAWIYHTEQAQWCSFPGTSGCFTEVKYLCVWEGEQPEPQELHSHNIRKKACGCKHLALQVVSTSTIPGACISAVVIINKTKLTCQWKGCLPSYH